MAKTSVSIEQLPSSDTEFFFEATARIETTASEREAMLKDLVSRCIFDGDGKVLARFVNPNDANVIERYKRQGYVAVDLSSLLISDTEARESEGA